MNDYKDCNLGKVPGNILMTSGNKSELTIQQYKDAFSAAQKKFGPTSAYFNMFDSDSFKGRDLLFSDSAMALKDVGEKNTYKKWLGEGLVDTIDYLDCNSNVTDAKSAGVSLRGLGTTVFFSLFLCLLQRM